LYIYKEWDNKISPFVERLVNKSKQGVDVKVILNYNPYYEATNEKCNKTKQYFEEYGIEVKFVFTNWSYFTNMHNKGMIVDNKSVLISSINWNENSVTRNREAGIIIENEEVAEYYAEVFFYDWNLSSPQPQNQEERSLVEYKNTIYIAVIFTMTFALIARDWRKREWV
jgi:phosphatidylserine/phosphatidylglycerophosphate/cardiolipin synthase-like enzyme